MKTNRVIFLAWFAPLLFMLVAFYVLFNSQAPFAAKIVFTSVPVLIWLLGGLAIYREYHEQKRERRKEDEILEEARRILNMPQNPADRRHSREKKD